MSEEEVIDNAAPASEDVAAVTPDQDQQVDQQEKLVPLSALQAERKKRQEMEYQNRVYQEYLERLQKPQEEQPKEDDEEWISRGQLKQNVQMTKQEILEQVFMDSNPEKVNEINQYLEKIIEKKPWLAQTISAAPNRYARAFEVVQDYKHLVAAQQRKADDAKRIVENAQKPGSPAAIAKNSGQSNADFLLSMRGKPEFRKYRQELLGR